MSHADNHHFWNHNFDPWAGAPPWALELRAMLGIIIENQGAIMAAIDDLKTSIAALIAEATTDITTLINNAASNSADPAIQQLAADVQTATANLHTQFTAATGTPVPAPVPVPQPDTPAT